MKGTQRSAWRTVEFEDEQPKFSAFGDSGALVISPSYVALIALISITTANLSREGLRAIVGSRAVRRWRTLFKDHVHGTATLRCFFCNQDVTFNKEELALRGERSWRCGECGSMNGSDELDRQRHNGTTAIAEQIRGPIGGSSTTWSSNETSPFCPTCTQNHEIVRRLVAEYDPQDDYFHETVDSYRSHLEEVYPSTCASCSEVVSAKLAAESLRLKQRLFYQRLRDSSAWAEEDLTVVGSWLESSGAIWAVVWGSDLCWWMATMAMSVWHLRGVLYPHSFTSSAYWTSLDREFIIKSQSNIPTASDSLMPPVFSSILRLSCLTMPPPESAANAECFQGTTAALLLLNTLSLPAVFARWHRSSSKSRYTYGFGVMGRRATITLAHFIALFALRDNDWNPGHTIFIHVFFLYRQAYEFSKMLMDSVVWQRVWAYLVDGDSGGATHSDPKQDQKHSNADPLTEEASPRTPSSPFVTLRPTHTNATSRFISTPAMQSTRPTSFGPSPCYHRSWESSTADPSMLGIERAFMTSTRLTDADTHPTPVTPSLPVFAQSRQRFRRTAALVKLWVAIDALALCLSLLLKGDDIADEGPDIYTVTGERPTHSKFRNSFSASILVLRLITAFGARSCHNHLRDRVAAASANDNGRRTATSTIRWRYLARLLALRFAGTGIVMLLPVLSTSAVTPRHDPMQKSTPATVAPLPIELPAVFQEHYGLHVVWTVLAALAARIGLTGALELALLGVIGVLLVWE
ncbi:Ima1 N-terminal domain-containing protein [Fimicolochytrium jonesii]|uniref:Ima1 N-terminal domain-containing protein n=1 Tax=Fimicolochytrium jonesii TaxID=1396493 RepID=UPI0022FF2E3A|nr:Ima1 N-terminal domain-containing protein [Fimicolochytrium jonesii]KAI8822369.1 Ima1 N-terminal domain-containing protein [Fimicolochytrium jonesii]